MKKFLHVTDVLPYRGPRDGLALERGFHVHHACHLLDERRLEWSTVHPDWKGYVESWAAGKEKHDIVVTASEVAVVNEEARYVGTTDKCGFLGRKDRRVIIDLKTGEPTPVAALQLAAYRACFKERNLERIVAQLMPDGSPCKLYRESLSRRASPVDFKRGDYYTFLSYLSIAYWEIDVGLRQWPEEREKRDE